MPDRTLEQENAQLRLRLEQAERKIRALRSSDSTKQQDDEQPTTAHQPVLSEAARRFAMQAAGVGSWTWDAASGLVTWSQETYELFGVDPSTPLLYDSLRTTVHPDDSERREAAVRRALTRGEDLTVEYRIRHPVRGERWMLSIGRVVDPVHRPGHMTGISIDITARKRAEQASRESEQRFRRMADALPVLIWVSDVSKGCTWFNKGWLDFCGRPMEALVGDGWAQDVHADDLERCLGDYAKQFDARQPFVLEYRLRRRDS